VKALLLFVVGVVALFGALTLATIVEGVRRGTSQVHKG
jgi:hypothetical protein